jgi:nitrogen regulatory protein PII
MKLTKGQRYRAELELGLIQRQFGNDRVKSELEGYGLKEVVVTGDGKYRTAEATYKGETMELELPKAIKSIIEI